MLKRFVTFIVCSIMINLILFNLMVSYSSYVNEYQNEENTNFRAIEPAINISYDFGFRTGIGSECYANQSR